jgi:hypothetical protein
MMNRVLVATFTFAPAVLLAASPFLAKYLELIQIVLLINGFAIPAMIGYLVYISNSSLSGSGQKTFWFLVILMLHIIAMPIFWFKFIKISGGSNVST